MALMFFMLLKGCGGATGHVVSLRWTASPTPSVVYNVYRSPHGKNTYVLLNPSGFLGTTFNDTSVVANVEYDYQVTSENASDVESIRSNTFSIIVP